MYNVSICEALEMQIADISNINVSMNVKWYLFDYKILKRV